jgi:lysophospholipase II
MPWWSDVFGLHSNDKEDQDGFEQSKTRILKLIKEETDKNIPISRIAIGGFSQGGALALYTALTSSLNLAGVVALSTWLPLRDHVKVALTQEAKKLKILQVHGDADQVVAFQWGKESTELLSKLLASPPHFISISGMGHHADEKEIADVRKFLRDIFPPSP